MNIQAKPCAPSIAAPYKLGHRDARHEAAELANKADAEIERLRAELGRVSELLMIAGTDRAGLRAEVEGLRARTVAVPDGWRLVPVEPTAAMFEAGNSARPYREDDGPEPDNTRLTWSAMLAAAPAPPVQGEAQEPHGWISCDDRMPPDDADVLVYIPRLMSFGIVAIDNWDERSEMPLAWTSATISIGHHWATYEPEDVTHWQPLPRPPKLAADAAGESKPL